MSITPENLVLVAVKQSVVAFDRRSGERVWTQKLVSSLSEDFVTVVADARQVYAHTKGEVFCLDLFTGEVLWRDGLRGFGYGIASIALPGGPTSGLPQAQQKQVQAAKNSSATAHSTTG